MTESPRAKKEPAKKSTTPSPSRTKKSSAEAKSEKLTKKVKELETSLKELQDRHLRLRAEFDNYRKRKEREISRLLEYEGEGIIRSLLPVVDDLERMVRSANGKEFESVDSMIEGINLIFGNVMKRLRDLNVEPFESVGKVFDPDLHEAMLVRESDKHGENEVLEEYEKGYRFKGKVIRHAKVVVNAAGKE
ncbi:MAG: nucleotide exchange factor GrpE [Fidelibacterota bacterium]